MERRPDPRTDLGPPTGRAGIAVVAALSLVATLLVLVSPVAPAGAEIAPLDPRFPATVSADALPTVQIDGVAWDQVVVGDTVYVTGEFSQARPAGAAPGQDEIPRTNLLAYDVRTGELDTTWAPTLNNQGLVITASEDGSTIFVGGDFSMVSGQYRNRVVALDAQTGAVDPDFNVVVNTRVQALAAVGDTLYMGGYFTTVDGVSRSRLAAVDTTDGTLLPWAPVVDREVVSMVAHEPSGRVIVGGSFNLLNGELQPGMGSVDGVTGANRPWAINQIIKNSGPATEIAALVTDGDLVYGVGWTFVGGGGTANFEGQFAADPLTGELAWVNGCRGDNYDLDLLHGVVYAVGHPHDCGMIGGLPQHDPNRWQLALAFDARPSIDGRENAYGPQANWQHFPGLPAAETLHWYPTVEPGSYTGITQGGWTIESHDDYVVMGGEFPSVNGIAQQGLVRFPVGAIAPNQEGPKGYEFLKPTVTPLGPGTVQVGWKAAFDRDDARITYELLRGETEATSTVIATFVRDRSMWWERPQMGFVDHTAPPGTSQTYRLRVRDPHGNGFTALPTTGAVPAGVADVSSYAELVEADGAVHHWRFGESAPGKAHNWVAADDLTVVAGATPLAAGAIEGDTNGARHFPGTSSTSTVIGVGKDWQLGLQEFSVEAWVRTTSVQGGKIIGYGNSRTGRSSDGLTDRNLYLTNDGSFRFGVRPDYGQRITVGSGPGHNDGAWHHVVGTLGDDGLHLYVDGQLVDSDATVTEAQEYPGYWRVGGDQLSNWPDRPSREAITADLDEIAVYPTALTAAQVAEHRDVGVDPPTASFTTTITDLDVDVDASASVDNGTVVSWDWDFGDGSTATGETASHTYAAEGTYTLQLTVTDDDGATDSVSQEITVIAPNVAPTASFTSTIDELDVYLDASGSTDPDGSIVSWDWDFGDGSIATGETVSHTYAAEGTQTVTLTVTDDEGATDTFSDDVEPVEPPNGAPKARYQFTPDFLDVDFDASGSTDSDGSIVSWDWDFGDGSIGTGEMVSHTYGAEGTYSVRLTVTDDDGATDSITKSVFAEAPNVAPTADFSSTIVDLDVDFDASGSTDSDGSIVSWDWDFGDGSIGTGEMVSHPYATAGIYTVQLTVTDDEGATATSSDSVEAIEPNVLPSADFDSVVDFLDVDFDASGSTDPDGSIVSWDWDFGDGSTGTGETVSHLYGNDGTYVVELSVTDDRGGVDVATASVTVEAQNTPPTAAFAETIDELVVSVDASASVDPDGTIVSWQWDFGDGTTGTGETTTHTYAADGTYTIGLTVVDDDGDFDTATATVSVAADPVVDYALDDFERVEIDGWGAAVPGGPWTLSGTSSAFAVDSVGTIDGAPGVARSAMLDDVDARDVDIATTISFDQASSGDGTYFSIIGRRVAPGTEYRAKLRHRADGAVLVYLERRLGNATTVLGAYQVPGLVLGAGDAVRVRFQATGSSTTTLRAKVWVAGSPEPLDWMLSASDTTPAALQSSGSVGVFHYVTPSVTAAPTVSVDGLAVRSPFSGTELGRPVAAFSLVASDLQVDADASASTDDGSIASYDWDFGDGTSGSGVTATHTYASPGLYTVTLMVTDGEGLTDTASQSVNVTDGAGPPAAFVVDSFDRSVVDGLGTADLGGPWTLSGPATSFGVDGAAHIATPVGQSRGAFLTGEVSTSAHLQATVSLDTTAAGGDAYVSIFGRRVSNGNDYRAKLRYLADGRVGVYLIRTEGGVETVLAWTVIRSLTVAGGDQLHVRFEVSGTSIAVVNVKVWKAANPEPVDWLLSSVAAAPPALRSPGHIGSVLYVTPTWSAASPSLSIDDLTVRPVE